MKICPTCGLTVPTFTENTHLPVIRQREDGSEYLTGEPAEVEAFAEHLHNGVRCPGSYRTTTDGSP